MKALARKQLNVSRKGKVFALSIGQGMGRIVSVLIGAVMARALAKDEVAAYKGALVVFGFAAPLLQMGLNEGLNYFLPAEKQRVRGRTIEALILLTSTAALFGAFLGFGGSGLIARNFENPKVGGLLLWLIPYALITIPTSVASAVWVTQHRVYLSSAFGVTRQLLIGLATIIPMLVWGTALSAMMGQVFGSILLGTIALILMVRATPADSARPKWTSMREMAAFSLPLGMASMLGTMSMMVDKLIVAAMCGDDVFAVYSMSAIEIPLIAVVTGSITAIMIVEMRQAIAAKNYREACRLFRLSAEKSATLLLPITFFFLVNADGFIRLYLGDGYATGATPFRIYVLALPVRTMIFSALLVALGASRFIMWRSFGGLALNALLSVPAVLYFGANGAAVVTTIVLYGFTVALNARTIQKKTGLHIATFIPLKAMARIFFEWVWPVAFMLLMSLHFLRATPVAALLVNSLMAGVYGAWWAEGKLYTREQLLRKLRRVLPRGTDSKS